jgi:hypothetical protein
MTWQRTSDSTVERHGYRIVRSASILPGVNVYHVFAPGGALICVGGDVTADGAKRFCEEHEKPGK